MASKQVEQEIDDFANNYPLRRRTFVNRPEVIKDQRSLDALWRSLVRRVNLEIDAERYSHFLEK